MSDLSQFIVYACPTGPLNQQIEEYYAQTKQALGPNTAHEYMPHCTLTGFFRDEAESIPIYISALERAVFEEAPGPAPITVTGMPLLPEWLGLTLEAEELREKIARFARYAESPTRREALRLKDNLHVSLAYGFPADQFDELKQMAEVTVMPTSPVGWDLRFYERRPGNQWIVHYSRSL